MVKIKRQIHMIWYLPFFVELGIKTITGIGLILCL